MPRDLARDPDRTVFAYGGIISPPRDWDRWTALVRELVAHLAERYGRDEVADWAFEVWNEPNLGLFWDDAESAYLRLYDAIGDGGQGRRPAVPGGWPGDRGGGWVDDLLAHCRRDGHAHRLRQHPHLRHAAARPAADHRPVRPAGPPAVVDRVGRQPEPRRGAQRQRRGRAPLVARGMRSAAGRLDALSYWVASDHFVELGEAERLFHGGFGLLTIGNLRKPRFWAIAMLESLGDARIRRSRSTGDGAGSLVEAWASRDDDGRVAIAVWNGTLEQIEGSGRRSAPRTPGRARDRRASPAAAYELRHRRVDATHSNIRAAGRSWARPTGPMPTAGRRCGRPIELELLEPAREITATEGGSSSSSRCRCPRSRCIDLDPPRLTRRSRLHRSVAARRAGERHAGATGAGCVATFLDNGVLFGLHADDVMVNLVLGSPMGGGLGNVFLRAFDARHDRLDAAGRAGRAGAGSSLGLGRRALGGRWLDLDYTCTLRARSRGDRLGLARPASRIARRRPAPSMLVLAQDVGLAHEAAVRTNELYTSQYIDHTVVRDADLGFVVLSRQNLAQAGAHPWVAHGCSRGADGYLTDGFQLYGTGVPGERRAGGARPPPAAQPDAPVRGRAAHPPVPAHPSPAGRVGRDRVRRRLPGRPPGGVRAVRRAPWSGRRWTARDAVSARDAAIAPARRRPRRHARATVFDRPQAVRESRARRGTSSSARSAAPGATRRCATAFAARSSGAMRSTSCCGPRSSSRIARPGTCSGAGRRSSPTTRR